MRFESKVTMTKEEINKVLMDYMSEKLKEKGIKCTSMYFDIDSGCGEDYYVAPKVTQATFNLVMEV